MPPPDSVDRLARRAVAIDAMKNEMNSASAIPANNPIHRWMSRRKSAQEFRDRIERETREPHQRLPSPSPIDERGGRERKQQTATKRESPSCVCALIMMKIEITTMQKSRFHSFQ